jgi:hypothetical protein
MGFRQVTAAGTENLSSLDGPFLHVGNLSVPDPDSHQLKFCIRRRWFERCLDDEAGRIRSVIVRSDGDGNYSFPGWLDDNEGNFAGIDGTLDFGVDPDDLFIAVLIFGSARPTHEFGPTGDLPLSHAPCVTLESHSADVFQSDKFETNYHGELAWFSGPHGDSVHFSGSQVYNSVGILSSGPLIQIDPSAMSLSNGFSLTGGLYPAPSVSVQVSYEFTTTARLATTAMPETTGTWSSVNLVGSLGLGETSSAGFSAEWDCNTDFRSSFVDLLFDIAISHGILETRGFVLSRYSAATAGLGVASSASVLSTRQFSASTLVKETISSDATAPLPSVRLTETDGFMAIAAADRSMDLPASSACCSMIISISTRPIRSSVFSLSRWYGRTDQLRFGWSALVPRSHELGTVMLLITSGMSRETGGLCAASDIQTDGLRKTPIAGLAVLSIALDSSWDDRSGLLTVSHRMIETERARWSAWDSETEGMNSQDISLSMPLRVGRLSEYLPMSACVIGSDSSVSARRDSSTTMEQSRSVGASSFAVSLGPASLSQFSHSSILPVASVCLALSQAGPSSDDRGRESTWAPSLPIARSAALFDSMAFGGSVGRDRVLGSEFSLVSANPSLSYLLLTTTYHPRETVSSYDALTPESSLRSLASDRSQGSTVIWASVGSAVSVILLGIGAVLVLMMGRHRSSGTPTEMTEPELNITTDPDVWSTAVDPYLSGENALSGGGGLPGQIGWTDDPEEDLVASGQNEPVVPIGE